ncbi:protein translocase subunit SecD [Blautia stercoris]|uniref:Multifunctional fusion protein n=1 Tax=Blautia stercoris TaxID=871664 RepID=A0ABR7P9H5_9FIRM|nr:protein translocase subunit SecD [Blautia stercoris]MBC8628026.1 protein translocase subunit SecD [Blautia stercoris]
MKKSRGILVLILTVFMTAFLAFTSAVGLGPTGTGAAKNIKRGLDLSGGVSITYEASKKNPTDDEMSDTIYKLQKRVENYSSEAQVYKEGDNRINVEIPDVTDANAILEELGTPGSLYFIAHKGSDGTENYSTTDGVTYTLNKTIEELEEDGSIVLTGTDVKTASAQVVQDDLKNNTNVVDLTLTKDGTDKFAEATKAAYEDSHDSIGIYYDGEFVSVPSVNAEIKDGKAQISGMKNAEEAESLASTIRIGGLKLELKELRSNVVAAQLGEEAIATSLKAAAIGLILVILFMILVYRVPGVVAGVALIIYTCLDLICLNAFDLTLTLPGVAGIILSIGMAVDANVIIYARIQEEISAGKSVQTAIKSGFQKAFSAILDGNVTTLIAAFVLNWLGTGSVKGFAQTLALGIVLSMFTALVVSRFVMYAVYAVGVRDKKFYGAKKEREPIHFLAKKKIFFTISLILVLSAPVAMIIFGKTTGSALKYSLEFQGGTSTNVTFKEDMTIQEIDSKVTPVVEEVTGDKNIQATKVVGSNQVIIKTITLDVATREKLDNALVENFDVDPDLITSESISSTVSKEMRSDAVKAVIIATILMLLYIWFRFKDIRFAGSAVLALIHDVLVVLAFYAIARVSVGTTFIACMLTIVGYSINATIVIFDRIRENLKTAGKKKDLELVVNTSITQTLTRSIYTSLTTFIMVFFLFVLGVSSVREFAMPLMVGIVCGGYSSVCITGALWYVMRTKLKKK